MSPVTCHVSPVIIIFFMDKVVELVGGGSVINGAYLIQILITHFITNLCSTAQQFSYFQGLKLAEAKEDQAHGQPV